MNSSRTLCCLFTNQCVDFKLICHHYVIFLHLNVSIQTDLEREELEGLLEDVGVAVGVQVPLRVHVLRVRHRANLPGENKLVFKFEKYKIR